MVKIISEKAKTVSMEYDPDVDSGYIYLRPGEEVHHTRELAQNIIADYNENRKVIGIELLDLRKLTKRKFEKAIESLHVACLKHVNPHALSLLYA